jgi:hypothetical protein
MCRRCFCVCERTVGMMPSNTGATIRRRSTTQKTGDFVKSYKCAIRGLRGAGATATVQDREKKRKWRGCLNASEDDQVLRLLKSGDGMHAESRHGGKFVWAWERVTHGMPFEKQVNVCHMYVGTGRAKEVYASRFSSYGRFERKRGAPDAAFKIPERLAWRPMTHASLQSFECTLAVQAREKREE